MVTYEEKTFDQVLGQSEKDNSERKKRILYEMGADVCLCEFGNGEKIQVNKSLLAYHSTVFTDEFYGEQPATTLKIDDFDFETFRTFLDCLFGLKVYTVLDALLIYPIAYKYDVKESLEKCRKILSPNKMDENMCLTFNLATFYHDTELEEAIISFLNRKVGIFKFLDSESNRNTLEPSTISRIIRKTKMNSLLWKMIYQWGKSYLEKSNKVVNTICSLFKDNDILSQLSLKDFESASSILEFHNLSNKELLDANEILNFLNENTIWKKNLPDRSLWIEVKKGDEVKESIKLKDPMLISRDRVRRGVSLVVLSNLVYYKDLRNVNCCLRYCCKYRSSSGSPDYHYLTPPSDLFLKEVIDIFNGNVEEFSYRFSIDPDCRLMKITEIVIIYKFSCDCIILKTSDPRYSMSDELCFTRDLNWL